MEDKELDNLLAKWAQEEMEVPFVVHEKTMQCIREEARRKKIKRWGNLATIAAVCCLCVPLAVNQMNGEKQNAATEESMLMMARSEVNGEKIVKAAADETVYNINAAAMMKEENQRIVVEAALEEDGTEENLTEEIWIERLTQLENDSKLLVEQRKNYEKTPTPKVLAEINAETERLLNLVGEYEQTLDAEYTALTLRLAAVKETLATLSMSSLK